ncbi:MAG: hypothetical protein R6X02_09885 [Enhygromyxa sp.]
MQSISDPLNLLHEDGAWFARAHELRLWVVRCDENLRKPVLTLLPKLEFHHDNDRAWPVLIDAHTSQDDGWQLRANNLAADWSRRVEAFAEAGVTQVPVEAQHGPTGLEAFHGTLAQIGRVVAPPLSGLVVVLAPTIVESGAPLEAELYALLTNASVADCRFVLILGVEVEPPRALIEALGPAACLVTTCEVDDAQRARDFAAMLASSAPAQFGMAGPEGVVPPRRVDDPPPLPVEVRDAALRAKGIDPAMIDGAPEIRAKVLGAAIALEQGRGDEAIRLQSEACERCMSLGLFELAVITRVGLAAYLSGLGQRPAAKQQVRAAIELAQRCELHRCASQAQLSLGLLHALDREYESALGAYSESARSAEAGAEPTLAIEGWRMAGQLSLQLGDDQTGANAFNQALRVAAASSAELVAASSASEAARSLAAVYERHGMRAQAISLYEQADAMEQGEGQVAPGEASA